MAEIDYGRLDALEAALGGRAAIEAAYGAGRALSVNGASPPPLWKAGTQTAGSIVRYAGALWAAPTTFTDTFFDPAQWTPVTAQPPLRPSLALPSNPAATVITTFQSGHGFTATNTSSSNLNDTSDFAMGKQCATATSTGTGTGCRIANTALPAFDTTGKQLVLVGRIDNPQHLVATGTKILVSLGNDAGFANYWKLPIGTFQQDFLGGTDGQWIRLVVNWADATIGAGAPTRSGIVAVQIQITDDATGNPVTMHWNFIGLEPEPATAFPNGVCSITFDDCYAGAWNNGKPIMDAAGLAHTKYLIQSVLGTSGRQTLTQLQREQDLGLCELAGHAYTDSMHGAVGGYNAFTTGQVEADLYMLKAWMVQNGFRGSDLYAYPQGFQDAATLAAVRQLFTAARTTYQGTLETLPPGDPLRMKAISGIGSFGSNTAAAVNARIDAAKANHAWIILTFHDITTAVPTAATQCQTTDFQTIISHIQSSGITCLPVGSVLKAIA